MRACKAISEDMVLAEYGNTWADCILALICWLARPACDASARGNAEFIVLLASSMPCSFEGDLQLELLELPSFRRLSFKAEPAQDRARSA